MASNGFTIDTSDFRGALRRLAQINQKSQAENLRSAARSVLSNPRGSGLLQITPPASAGSTGTDAKQAGEAAIKRDLASVFTGVRLKHKRAEAWPDVAGIHRRLFLGKRPGAPLRSDRGRAGYYVDARKLATLFLALKANVGKLASGWLAAAQSLGVRAPAWISRHGSSRGDVRSQLTGSLLEIEMACRVPPNASAAELERRVAYALDYERKALERQTEFLVARDAQRAGFKTSA